MSYLVRNSFLNLVKLLENLSRFFWSKLRVISAISLSKHRERRCCWSAGCKLIFKEEQSRLGQVIIQPKNVYKMKCKIISLLWFFSIWKNIMLSCKPTGTTYNKNFLTNFKTINQSHAEGNTPYPLKETWCNNHKGNITYLWSQNLSPQIREHLQDTQSYIRENAF